MAYLPTCDTLGSQRVGDVPDSPMVVAFHDETGNPALTNHFTTLQTNVYNPLGDDYGVLTTVVHDGHEISLTWPTLTKFNMAGIFTLRFHFVHDGHDIVTPEPLQFVVEDVDGWLSLEQARQLWADAPLDDVFLYTLLQTAKDQCVAYAPVLAPNAQVPLRYTQAQLTQARALYQSTIANQNDNVGLENFTVRVFPLDFTIRAMLRPKRAIGGMF